jgi:hypothetical protein
MKRLVFAICRLQRMEVLQIIVQQQRIDCTSLETWRNDCRILNHVAYCCVNAFSILLIPEAVVYQRDFMRLYTKHGVSSSKKKQNNKLTPKSNSKCSAISNSFHLNLQNLLQPPCVNTSIIRQLRVKACPQNRPLPNRNDVSRIILNHSLRNTRFHLVDSSRQLSQDFHLGSLLALALRENLLYDGCTDKDTRER